MVLKLVPSLAPGNNKLPSEAWRLLSFVFFSCLHHQFPQHSCLPQQGTFSGSLQCEYQPQWFSGCHYSIIVVLIPILPLLLELLLLLLLLLLYTFLLLLLVVVVVGAVAAVVSSSSCHSCLDDNIQLW